MVNSSILIIGLAGVLGLAFFLSRRTSASNDVPTLSDFANQQETVLGTTQTGIGAVNLPEGKANSPSEVLSNVVTGNLFTEDDLRNLINSELGKREQVTVTPAGSEVSTTRTTIRDLDISTPKSLELFRNDTSSLIVHDSFNPIGDAELIGIRNKFISKNAKARTEPTFSGTITTKAGGTRNILGSEALFKRLQDNLSR